MEKSGKKAMTYPLLTVVPALVVYTLFAVIPIIISFFYSFIDQDMERLYDSTFIGMKNCLELISSPVFLKSISNTFLFTVSITVLKTIVGFVLALALIKNLYGRGLMRTVFYVPCAISITVVDVLFKSILANRGLLNNALTLMGLKWLSHGWLGSCGTAMGSVIFMETWMWAGFSMFIFLSGLQAIPQDYYESATLGDAPAFEKFKYIAMLLIVPSLTTVGTLSIAGGLKVFDIIYVITNRGPGFGTQVPPTYTYQSFSLGFLGESTAGSMILTVTAAAISSVMNRYLTKQKVEM